ncbi:MAG: hypothetical protein D8H95_00090 [Lachnospiraceae bacterium]|nr:MAG: hypothetical protein D8H95_00090 [Lachnospiraceae bacterium]
MSKKKIKKQQEAYFYGYAIYRDSNGIVHVDCITDLKERVMIYNNNKNLIIEIVKGISARNNFKLLAVAKVMYTGVAVAEVYTMKGVFPGEFSKELDATLEKHFNLIPGDIEHAFIGF